MKKYIFIIATILVLAVSSIVALEMLYDNTRPNDKMFNWVADAAWVKETGEVLNGFQLFVKGEITDKGNTAIMKLSLVFPDSDRYGVVSEFFCNPYGLDDQGSYEGNMRVYDRQMGVMLECRLYINPSEECLVIDWGDGRERFLVASTDSNLNPVSVMALFSLGKESYNCIT